MTNRYLYQAINGLGEKYKATDRTLEQFLSALLALSRPHRYQNFLSPFEFQRLISEAFVAPILPFDPAWRDGLPRLPIEGNSFEDWEAVLIRQIVDLREMDEAGILANEHRYFGVDAPRGGRWYNFDPPTYLECGMAGSFGGWDSNDTTPRMLVPGDVATWDAAGNIQIVRPEDILNPVIEMPPISWEQCIDFIECGQWYE